MDDRTVLSVCRDEDCPACGWPETYAEGPFDGGPTRIGCRHCGWWKALAALEPCRYCGRDTATHPVIPAQPEPPRWVCDDLAGCVEEQVRQRHPDEHQPC
jgi:hypothetical protein